MVAITAGHGVPESTTTADAATASGAAPAETTTEAAAKGRATESEPGRGDTTTNDVATSANKERAWQGRSRESKVA